MTNQGYRGYGNYRTGAPPSDHKFTGQKLDASTGLYYYNARYYDPVIGHFISPDTLVPDPTSVWDYNRFLYVRGNPLKFTDPSGYYSNDEIMVHFGCNDWACVEAYFQDGGAYAGLWGWLYVLQQAVDGDTVMATMIAVVRNGASVNHTLMGRFQRTQDGKITIHAYNYFDPTGVRPLDSILPERAFASFGAAGTYGLYQLRSQNANFGVGRDYRYQDCQNTDCVAVAIDSVGFAANTLQAGSLLCGEAAPACFAAGKTLGAVSAVASFTWTGIQMWREEATTADLVVSVSTTIGGGLSPDPIGGMLASGVQLVYDAVPKE